MTTPSGLVRLWQEFIGTPAERARTCGSHLRAIANATGARKIIDLAAGTGLDVTYLHDHGFIVDANEYDPGFRSELERTIGERPIVCHAVEWCKLPERIYSRYDLAFCLGNSLTYLHERYDQAQALAGMRELLMPHGRLVIDHRNYDAIFLQCTLDKSCRDHGLALKNEQMYCGTSVSVRASAQLYPEHTVTLSYTHVDGATADLQLYPFQLREFRELLHEAGFSRVRSYVNWRRIPERASALDYSENAFFQHVAQR